MRKLLFFAWLPLVVFLFPLPPQAAKQLQNEVHGTRLAEQSSVTGTAKESMTQQGSQAELAMFTSALWDRWMQNLGLLVIGLLVGVMAWRRYRHWEWLALGMSIFYLTLVVLRYVLMERPVPNSALFFETSNHFLRVIQVNLKLVEVGISNGSVMRPAWVVYREVVMPIFQLAVLVWLLWFSTWRKPQPQ
jgi:hypothetical protein